MSRYFKNSAILKKMLVSTRSYMYRLNRSMLILSPFNRVLNFNIEQLYWDYNYLISRGVFFSVLRALGCLINVLQE